MNKWKETLLLFCCLQAPVSAEDDRHWKLQGQLGGVFTSGNTSTSTLDLGLRLELSLGRFETTHSLKALNKEENGVTSARRLQYSSRVERLLDESRALFYSGQLLRDQFSGFERQDSLLLGYRQQWAVKRHTLKLRPAVGYRLSTRQDSDVDQEEFIASLGAEWQWKWSDNAKLETLLKSDWGDNNTHTTLETSLTSRLVEKLSLKLSLLLDHNSNVAANRENLDTTTSINLVYQLH